MKERVEEKDGRKGWKKKGGRKGGRKLRSKAAE